MTQNKWLYSQLYKKGKVLLTTSIIASTLFSCSKEEIESSAQAETSVYASAATTINPNLLYEETFEGSKWFPESGDASLINLTSNIENCNNGSNLSPATYDWTLSKITTHLEGNYAGKFEIRKNQPLVGTAQRVRSEVIVFMPQEDAKFANQPEMWYSYSLYLPSKGMEDDPNSKENLTQWFEDGGADCTIKMRNGRMYFTWINDFLDLFGKPNTPSTTSTTTINNTFTHIPLDSWHEFVFHFIHSRGSDGLVEIWRDGVKIHTLRGPNMHSSILPKWKVGLYKSDYTERPENCSRDYRIAYYDNIRVGKKGSSFADMTSSGGSSETLPPVPPANVLPVAKAGSDITITLPTNNVSLNGTATDSDGSVSKTEWTKVSGPSGATFSSTTSLTPTVGSLVAGTYTFRLTATDDQGATATDDIIVKVNGVSSSQITSFTLINAATEKDVTTMANNGSYSLSGLQLKPVNIRANTTASFAYIIFELSGALTLTYKDKAAPYALHGDDNRGNYFYGKWNPPVAGTYTLKATPYNASGVAGTPNSITFTITK